MKKPRNIEAERSLLCCLLQAENRGLKDIKEEILKLNDTVFHAPVHVVMFQTIKKLVQDGLSLDAITIAHFLKSTELNVIQDNLFDYISNDILECEPSPYTAPSHINILKDLERRRYYIDEIVSRNKEYVQARNDIVNKLTDVTTKLNEDEVTRFIGQTPKERKDN